MLQPVVRRTWAPRGQTPIHYSWDRRDRLSVLSAITVSAGRRRLGLYFDIVDHNIDTDEFERFVAMVRRRLQRPILLVLDRWSVHRCAAQRFLRRFPKQIQVEWLPAYAPELNPVEQVWNRTKYSDLANHLPENLVSLGKAVAGSIRNTRSQAPLLRSFFRHANLGL